MNGREAAAQATDEGSLKLEKSQAAFRTISEVADQLDVAQHVLRFWESKFPQVRPLKRGGGRRYYRPEDVAMLRRIRALLYDEGYTIRGAQRLLRVRRARVADPPTPEPRKPEPCPPRTSAATAWPGRRPPAETPARPAVSDTRSALVRLRADLAELRDLLAAAAGNA